MWQEDPPKQLIGTFVQKRTHTWKKRYTRIMIVTTFDTNMPLTNCRKRKPLRNPKHSSSGFSLLVSFRFPIFRGLLRGGKRWNASYCNKVPTLLPGMLRIGHAVQLPNKVGFSVETIGRIPSGFVLVRRLLWDWNIFTLFVTNYVASTFSFPVQSFLHTAERLPRPGRRYSWRNCKQLVTFFCLFSLNPQRFVCKEPKETHNELSCWPKTLPLQW